ncbi:hypothetical protein ACFLS9_10735, partial [Bacteroidota bacterium]
ETKKLSREQSERRHHIYNESIISNNPPIQQLFNADATILNTVIPDFQVNENAGQNGADQFSPSISADGSGNFIMAWRDERNGDPDIYAQRFSSDGTPLGANLKVNDDDGSALQWRSSISSDSSGSFVITWEDGRNGGYRDIYAQRYSSDGTPLGANLKVNDDQENTSQYYPSVSVDGSGNFVIAWTDSRNVGFDTYAQRYSNDGTALGANFKVNDDQDNANQFSPFISADGSGSFVIVWEDGRNDWQDEIYAQRYSSDGTPLGANFKVNDDSSSEYNYNPVISTDASGNFVIAWEDERAGDYNTDIYAQRYSGYGTPIGANFKVNDNQEDSWPGSPSISTDGSGNFVITWENGDDDWQTDIHAQRFSGNGTPIGTNFKVNDDQGTTDQGAPSVCADDSGNFVITWGDDRNEWHSDIYAQRYSGDGTLIDANFKVNDDQFSAGQDNASICIDNNGNFVVTWVDGRNDAGDIYAQRYSSDGTGLGGNFRINDDQGDAEQYYSSICIDVSSSFVVTWVDERNKRDIYAQRYSGDGTPLGANFKVNDNQGNAWPASPSISTDGSGNFVIVWEDVRNNWQEDIYAQRYSSDGTALGTNFKVNDDQGNTEQFYSSVCTDVSGNFVVTWVDARIDWDFNIYAQRYSSDGSALDTNFKVNNQEGTVEQEYPSISADSSGNFVITWVDMRRDWESDIYAQRYSKDGSALGTNFRVNDNREDTYRRPPSVSMDDGGNFVIIWENDRYKDSDIYAQRYSSDGSAVGSNFTVTNTSKKSPSSPDIRLWNDRIYSTWTDNRAGGTGSDIWANVLDWENPVGIND